MKWFYLEIYFCLNSILNIFPVSQVSLILLTDFVISSLLEKFLWYLWRLLKKLLFLFPHKNGIRVGERFFSEFFYFLWINKTSLAKKTNLNHVNPRSCKRRETLFQKSLLLFSTWRVLLQPPNSLLQPAKKVRI